MDITAPVKPPEQRRRRRRGGFFLRFFGFMFAAAMIVFVAVAGAAAFVLWKVSKDLPDYEVLAKYEPPVMTRIHANDGSADRRVLRASGASTCRSPRSRTASSTPSSRPRTRISISMAASTFRASSAPSSPISSKLQSGRRTVGASTITQQVAKNFLLIQRPDDRAQAEGGDPRHPHRARLHQGADPRALSERDLSRRGRLWRRRGGSDLLRQGAQRADARRVRLSRRAAQGAAATTIRSRTPSGRSRAATG